jgi:hypothetical protein
MNDGSARQKLDAAKSAVVAAWIKARDQAPDAGAGPEAEDGGGTAEQSVLDRYMPTPQVAAVAVMALLSAGVILGLVTDQLAQSASAPVVVLGEPASAPEPEPEGEAPEVETEYIEEEGPTATVTTEAPAPAPEQAFEEASPEEPAPEKETQFELPPETTLPPVSHVFMIVLADQGFEASFGRKSGSPYFSKTLAGKGELLSNYYAVSKGDLANEIALLSGQGPTPQTAAECPEYSDISPGTVDPATAGTTEVVIGEGCVYPATTLTLPGQLAEAGKSWKAYVEPQIAGAPPPAPCGSGGVPMGYFHSLLDSGECAASAVGLDQLAPDLAKTVTEVPTFSYIVPDACHDGSEEACAPGQPAGLAGTETFLQTVVPEIEASDAYKFGGLIAITFAEAPQSGPNADSSACCGTPQYPNLEEPAGSQAPAANGPVKSTGGGGRVGMLLISPYVLAGSVNKTGYFNHYTLLRSLEELFGLSALGYAADPAVIPFDESVYNNLES